MNISWMRMVYVLLLICASLALQISQRNHLSDVAAFDPNAKQIPVLKQAMAQGFIDINSNDPAVSSQFNQRIAYTVLQYLRTASDRNESLVQAQSQTNAYINKMASTTYDVKPTLNNANQSNSIKQMKNPLPNYIQNLNPLTKQNLVDSLHQEIQTAADIKDNYLNTILPILKANGGAQAEGGLKVVGIQGYLRTLSKISVTSVKTAMGGKPFDLDKDYLSQAYDLYNKIWDERLQSKSDLGFYISDLLRCRAVFNTVADVQKALSALQKQYGTQLIRIKNQLMNTEDPTIQLNIMQGNTITEVQLNTPRNMNRYNFEHFLYEFTREDQGAAYVAMGYTIPPTQDNAQQLLPNGLQTTLGLVKAVNLRKTLQTGFTRLTPAEAQQIRGDLKLFLGENTLVALSSGFIKNDEQFIHAEDYGWEVGEMFVIKHK